MQADEYSKLDKELLGYVEDVLLNRREDGTERILEYAATLDPKCKPTALKRIGGESSAPGATTIPPRQNPVPGDGLQAIAAPAEMPPVPEYKLFVDTLRRSKAFEQVGLRSQVTGPAYSSINILRHWPGASRAGSALQSGFHTFQVLWPCLCLWLAHVRTLGASVCSSATFAHRTAAAAAAAGPVHQTTCSCSGLKQPLLPAVCSWRR